MNQRNNASFGRTTPQANGRGLEVRRGNLQATILHEPALRGPNQQRLTALRRRGKVGYSFHQRGGVSREDKEGGVFLSNTHDGL